MNILGKNTTQSVSKKIKLMIEKGYISIKKQRFINCCQNINQLEKYMMNGI